MIISIDNIDEKLLFFNQLYEKYNKYINNIENIFNMVDFNALKSNNNVLKKKTEINLILEHLINIMKEFNNKNFLELYKHIYYLKTSNFIKNKKELNTFDKIENIYNFLKLLEFKVETISLINSALQIIEINIYIRKIFNLYKSQNIFLNKYLLCIDMELNALSNSNNKKQPKKKKKQEIKYEIFYKEYKDFQIFFSYLNNNIIKYISLNMIEIFTYRIFYKNKINKIEKIMSNTNDVNSIKIPFGDELNTFISKKFDNYATGEINSILSINKTSNALLEKINKFKNEINMEHNKDKNDLLLNFFKDYSNLICQYESFKIFNILLFKNNEN